MIDSVYERKFSIPDVCKNSSVLLLVIYIELFAVILTLVKYEGAFLLGLGPISLYCQWCALLSCSLLCLLRKRLNTRNNRDLIVGSSLCCLVPFLIIESCNQFILGYYQRLDFDVSGFVSRLLAVSVVTFFMLRYFSLMALLEFRSKAEMNQRILALQSRIRPHFLFNCLNTISELIHIDASKADQAVGSMAMLFRASLENEKRFHSLESEISLCKQYLDLERWRLGEKLSVSFQEHVKASQDIRVPKLILQPLIENAILHGTQSKGEISLVVDIRETLGDISLMVSNKRGAKMVIKEGHGIAVENIRERLFVLYDDRHSFKIKETEDNYTVIVRFPKRVTETFERS